MGVAQAGERRVEPSLSTPQRIEMKGAILRGRSPFVRNCAHASVGALGGRPS